MGEGIGEGMKRESRDGWKKKTGGGRGRGNEGEGWKRGRRGRRGRVRGGRVF